MSLPHPRRPPRSAGKSRVRPWGLLAGALVTLGVVIAGVYAGLIRRRRTAAQATDPASLRASIRSPESRPALGAARPEPIPSIPPAAHAPPREESRPREPITVVHALLLAGILATGFYFRFAGLNWDDYQHLHPDERFLTQVLTAVEIPGSLREYFDSANSSLNPRNRGHGFFVYGDFPITLTRFAAEGLAALCAPAPGAPIDAASGRPAPTAFDAVMRGLGFETFCFRADGSLRPMTGYDEVALVGRVMSALFDFGTLIWLFLIAREIYGVRAGLAATALGALAVLHLQQAHFFTADTFATHFVAAAFYFIVRAGRSGSMSDFVAAGICSGLAMASRINVAPVLGVLAIAAFGRTIRAWGGRGNGARIETALGQVIVAGIAALVTFRIFMPNAFDGLLSPDPRWLDNMAFIQKQVIGEITSPPDVQWTDRTPIVFPWVNMVFWGLGVPLGLTAWIGWAIAGWQTLARPFLARENRTIGEWLRGVVSSRHLLIWMWVTPYFIWQGSQWVKSMRYLLPLYPFMAMFAGWLLVATWDWARSATAVRRLEAGVASHKDAVYRQVARVGAYALPVVVLAGTLLWAVAFTEIYRRPTPRVVASEWIYENVPTAATLHYTDARGAGPRDIQLQLPSVTTFVGPGSPHVTGFSLPADGELTGVTFRSLSGLDDGLTFDTGKTAVSRLLVKIAPEPNGEQVIAEGSIDVAPGSSATAYGLSFDGARLEAGRQYYFIGEAAGGTLIATSSALGNEHWDDGIPLRTGGRDGFSFYRGLEIQNYNDDTPEKLGQMIAWLDQADYIFLTSNRLYGSIPRQPLRYPLATEYYRLLFTGQLGFELVEEFTSYPTLGPFEFPDQETTQALRLWPDPTRLPRPGVISVPYPPAEEAFSVYDHPRVLIFKKRADFSLQDVITKLSGLDLEAAYHGFTPRNETGSPTGQMLGQQAWDTQQASGTWSDVFDRNSVLNTRPGIGTVVWYALVGILGWATFPILFVAAPGLADRGYGLARTLGVLLLSFLIWFPASFRALPFTRETIALMVVVLAAVGGLIARARWVEIRDYVRRNARLILVEELVFAAAFVLFLLLRYGNPDLWHPWRGGEKPMDFAYFNAVIKSQYFPPYDPWFSGGFLTYYYYGWVMLAALTKLLGIVPAIAYNLAVPTIYALAALGTFSVAHGLAVRFGSRQRRGGGHLGGRHLPPPLSFGYAQDRRSEGLREMPPMIGPATGALPIAVGVLAAVFVMLIGNLGEVKLLYEEVGKVGQVDSNPTIEPLQPVLNFGSGLIKLASGQQALSLPSDWWYWNPTRIIPPGEGEAGPITEFPFFTFLYADLHAHMMALPITILMLGFAVSWLTYLPLRQGADEPVVLSATEAQRSHRFVSVPPVSPWFKWVEWVKTYWTGLLSLALGGLAIGGLRATNTADYPTYVGVGLAALAFGTWAAEPLKAKETWFWFVARVGLLLGSSLVFFAPFAQSDRLGGTALDGWLGSKTPLLEYLFVHGIFLFPIVTYLYIEARRWGLRWMAAVWNWLGEWRWLVGVPLAIGLLVTAYFALYTEVWVVVAAVPLMLATGALMVRPRLPAITRFWMLMVFLALALSLAVEVVVFRGDISRMNMVFKFYYQIWVLLGIAGAVALGWLWQRASIDLPRLNGGWRTAAVALVIGGMLYPPFAARAKLSERFYEGAPPGLDGMAYMREAVHHENERELHLRWDYEALTWMQDHVAGTPVVAEGHSRHEYLWGGRVSIYTGLPTPYGWNNHQRQQRGVVVPHSLLDRRIQDVALLFGNPSLVTAQKILDRYGVKYIYVGELEKAYYPPEGLAKFDRMVEEGVLRVAYTNPGVTIYEVVKRET